MIRFVTRLAPKKAFLPFSFAHIPFKTFCNANSTNLPIQETTHEISKYPLAVNFFSVLTQYQIDKMKATSFNQQSNTAAETQLQQYAEEIFTSSQIDQKVTMTMLQKLNQENLITKQMVRNLLDQITPRSHETLHRFSMEFLVTLLREIDRHGIELLDIEKAKLRSLILYQLGAVKVEFVKDFVDVFAGRGIARQLFNEEIEEKLIWILNYSVLQVRNFQFFSSLAFSIYSLLSNSPNGDQLIPRLEDIVEEKFNAKGASYDINDIENLLFFFPEDRLFSHNTMSLLAHNILSFNSKISSASFKKFLKLSLVNKYVISLHPKQHQEKIFHYISDCDDVHDLRLFADYLDQINMYTEPIDLEPKILTAIRKFLPQMFKDDDFKEKDVILSRFLLDRTSDVTERNTILAALKTAIKEVRPDTPFAGLCALYSMGIVFKKEGELELENLEKFLNFVFEEKDSDLKIPDISEALKHLMKTKFVLEDLTTSEREVLGNAEIMFRSETFQKALKFVDLKEFFYLVKCMRDTSIVSSAFLLKLTEKAFEKFKDMLIIDEIVQLIPLTAQISFMYSEVLPYLFNTGEALAEKKEVTLEFMMKLCTNLDVVAEQLSNNRETRKAFKPFWIAYQRKMLKLITTEDPKASKKKNPFLPDDPKDKKKVEVDAPDINEFLSERDLTIIKEVFEYLIKWNVGSIKAYDTFQAVFTHYFDKYKQYELPRLAYNLSEINSPQDEFTTKLEKHLLKVKECGTPLDALFYAWFFAVKNNYSQELWNVIMKDLNKLDSIDDIPVKYLMNLYEILFSLKVEKSYVNIDKFTQFIDKLDEIWEENHVHQESNFKKAVNAILTEECYIVEPRSRASLYKVDYTYNQKSVVLVLGDESYLSDISRQLGHIELRKRLLKKLGFRLHVITKRKYLSERRVNDRLEYIKKQMQGIPRDQEKWKAIRNMKIIEKASKD